MVAWTDDSLRSRACSPSTTGHVVIIFGFSMLKGVAGTLDAAPPVSDYVRLRKNDGSVESIFVGDIWQLLTGSGELIGKW